MRADATALSVNPPDGQGVNLKPSGRPSALDCAKNK